MKDNEYFAAEGMSATLLKAGAVSMKLMRHRATTKMAATPSMRMGTMMHAAILEPEKIDAMVVFDGDKLKKEYKDLKAEYGADNIITSKERQEFDEIRQAVMDHPVVKELSLFSGGNAEVPVFWDSENGKNKAKIDYLAGHMVEYKSTASLDGFIPQCARLHYEIQLGHYWAGCGRKPVYVVAQENKAPWDVAVFEPTGFDLERWYGQGQMIYARYNHCRETGVFEGSHSHLMAFEMPAWAENDSDLNFAE